MTISSRVLPSGAAAAVCLAAVALSVPSAQAATPCAGAGLSAKVTGGAAGMSQPASYVTVTNTTSQPCSVHGYPTINGAWTKKGKQQITVSNGSVMNAPATKPKTIVLAPNGKAWFAIGAATAYDPPVVTFRRMSFTTGSGGNAVVRKLGLLASAPSGKPFPIGVTAFAKGVSPASG